MLTSPLQVPPLQSPVVAFWCSGNCATTLPCSYTSLDPFDTAARAALRRKPCCQLWRQLTPSSQVAGLPELARSGAVRLGSCCSCACLCPGRGLPQYTQGCNGPGHRDRLGDWLQAQGGVQQSSWGGAGATTLPGAVASQPLPGRVQGTAAHTHPGHVLPGGRPVDWARRGKTAAWSQKTSPGCKKQQKTRKKRGPKTGPNPARKIA